MTTVAVDLAMDLEVAKTATVLVFLAMIATGQVGLVATEVEATAGTEVDSEEVLEVAMEADMTATLS